ncbi:SCP2 sterol-binding domain-containing protein [Telmatospirillum sp.]|uniref:ubiquinone anaerobic biosynthesis accessory factor UbiT n=1 Tax=Telmatospirillum sp. TaxID=2079197 RepID=UPI00284311C4|nr:SCP2 sterol-binding domain-containing protein [Telmatospirillum sp.]MDR3440070.1 SCP2 sterol-binding domain-containing protein [Telmatospirillum sp.]
MSNPRTERSRPVDPPFSPILLAGMALGPVPPRFLQPLFDAILAVVRRRHPDILDRLTAYPDAVIGIDPVDLPFVLLLEPKPDRPRLTVYRDFADLPVTAVIRGPLAMLIALGEGRLDGDAVFFSRQLVIEGDTEVIVALRNAVDGAGIDMEADFAATVGPLARPLLQAARVGGWLFRRLADDMALVRQALVGPALKSADAQAARLNELEGEIVTLRRSLRQREQRT